jgi:hypothetical protein
MSAANPNPMEKSMVSVLVVANEGGGSPLPCGVIGASGCFQGPRIFFLCSAVDDEGDVVYVTWGPQHLVC